MGFVNELSDGLVEMDTVSVVRDGVPILDDVSWSIKSQQHWALLGANGSGKTTLLKVVAGYEWPTKGNVKVLGKTYGHCDLREHRKHIGWVSATIEEKLPRVDSVLDIVLSGFDSSLGVYRAFVPMEMDKALASLGLVNMRSRETRIFGTLSQGEQQRTLIARALVSRPALLILDEPCAGLDPAARERFLEDLDELVSAPDAPALILVTHHIEEIRPWISHVHALRAGATLYQGVTALALTDTNLSRIFERSCRVVHDHGRFRMDILR